MQNLRGILELLFPPTCLICKSPERDLCDSCRSQITTSKFNGEISGIEYRAGALYEDIFSQLILMAKEQNISAARNVLADLLVAAYVQLNVHNGEVHSLGLIPIPSSKSANRERGFRHSYLLSTELRNRLCTRFGLSVDVVEILKVNRKISDQSKLNKVERGANVHQAYSISPDRRGFIQPGRNFVLVDDLVTTGSSMKEAIRCLRAAKISPLGAISAGVSPHLIS